MKLAHWLVVLGGLAAATPLAAQQAGKFIGIQGGATYSDICCSVNTDSRWGGTAGLVFGYVTPWYTGVMLEGNWVQKGGQNTRLDYVEIPLTVGAVVPAGGGRLQARVYGGIGIGFALSCTSTNTTFGCPAQKSPEWTVPFGIMFGTKTASDKLFALDVRYSLALGDAFEAANAHNRSWQFRALFGFPVGSR